MTVRRSNRPKNRDAMLIWKAGVRSALRIARIVAGILLIILGIIGLFLPVLQGVLFLVTGFALLGFDLKRLRNLRPYLAEQFPRIFRRKE